MLSRLTLVGVLGVLLLGAAPCPAQGLLLDGRTIKPETLLLGASVEDLVLQRGTPAADARSDDGYRYLAYVQTDDPWFGPSTTYREFFFLQDRVVREYKQYYAGDRAIEYWAGATRALSTSYGEPEIQEFGRRMVVHRWLIREPGRLYSLRLWYERWPKAGDRSDGKPAVSVLIRRAN